ncbi:hypothetical protein GCM10010222_56950 [Streptomyces tanashiensis]|nr:hypothetical protein GCM10010222_56950 [Streptomyces tanashiensis]
MVAGRRRQECDSCGVPYGTWVASLRMTLCAECERAGAAHPVREPVLVGDVLAGLADVVARPTTGAGGADASRAVSADASRAVSAVSALSADPSRAVSAVSAVSAVPQQWTPSAAAREKEASAACEASSPAGCDRCGAGAEWHRTA